jgi:plasmid stabilization system protein ParE
MPYAVIFTPEAVDQLESLYRYVAAAAPPEIARRYTGAIVTCCAKLCSSPQRDTRRDDVRPGLRITNYKKWAVIVFDVEVQVVSIIGVFYGSRMTRPFCRLIWMMDNASNVGNNCHAAAILAMMFVCY